MIWMALEGSWRVDWMTLSTWHEIDVMMPLVLVRSPRQRSLSWKPTLVNALRADLVFSAWMWRRVEEVSVSIGNFPGSMAFVFPIYTNSVLNGADKSEKNIRVARFFWCSDFRHDNINACVSCSDTEHHFNNVMSKEEMEKLQWCGSNYFLELCGYDRV